MSHLTHMEIRIVMLSCRIVLQLILKSGQTLSLDSTRPAAGDVSTQYMMATDLTRPGIMGPYVTQTPLLLRCSAPVRPAACVSTSLAINYISPPYIFNCVEYNMCAKINQNKWIRYYEVRL